MKTKSIFLILFFACQAIFAQVNHGVSVQGIARDAQKAALVDATLTFIFEIQDAAGGTSYYKEDVAIKTDPYGVFSHIVGTGNILAGSGNFRDIPFSKTHMKLVISVNYNGTNIVVSNAPFQYAPYAKSADNGVPIGTIVAFVGTAANVPPGWALCDGRLLTDVAGSANLRNLLGPGINRLPDLRGMFLRGTGTHGDNSAWAGPNLLARQDDGFKSHSIDATTSSAGSHSHGLKLDTGNGGTLWGSMIIANYGESVIANQIVSTEEAGAHTHAITGTSIGGINETRPVNYGVNYIIKL